MARVIGGDWAMPSWDEIDSLPRCKWMKCNACGHPRDDHSVYRDKCLTQDCDCTVCGGVEDRKP